VVSRLEENALLKQCALCLHNASIPDFGGGRFRRRL
jgi:hypothetical protein